MEVIIADKCGFCQGVRNAIKLAEETLKKTKDVYSFGPIIHNEDVVERLSDQGLKTVQSVDEIAGGTVLIRSHGATVEQRRQIEAAGLDIVDATCVLVKRVQQIAVDLEEEGYQVVIIGDKGHPEIQAVVGHTKSAIVLANAAEIPALHLERKLGVICQTTQSPAVFGENVGEIIKHGFHEIKVLNTLCKEAIKRQNAAVELCKKVDVMFVLGGLHSANTRKLAELCKKYNNQTFHLQNCSQLDKNSISGARVAGVTAGASTPDWVIQEFVDHLKSL